MGAARPHAGYGDCEQLLGRRGTAQEVCEDSERDAGDSGCALTIPGRRSRDAGGGGWQGPRLQLLLGNWCSFHQMQLNAK
jgi:hypothetical protein